MDRVKEGWFSEINPLWPGQCMSLQVEQILHTEKSKYQDIMILQTKGHGRALILDGVIQCTENDEFAYHEMMAFLPLFSHPNPEAVLVIGGGDGGIVREVSKHPKVKRIVLCEIDERVLEVSKKYLPSISCGLSSPKLELYVGDGFEFMKNHRAEFDVIITDSSDPVGPAESLFQQEYFELMKTALKSDGIICSQGECLWLHLKLIRQLQQFCSKLFPRVEYGCFSVPTYPSGQIGCVLCSANPSTDFKNPVHKLSEEEIVNMKLKFYNPDYHSACFALPQFAKLVSSKLCNAHGLNLDHSYTSQPVEMNVLHALYGNSEANEH